MRNFVLQNAVLYVRPNMRRNGFDIKLRTRLGIKFFTEAEFYARPGQLINVIYNNPNNVINNVEVIPEPEGLPIVVVWNENEHVIQDQNQNILYRELQPNDRVIIENDEIIIENIQGGQEPDEDENNNN